MGSCGRVPHQGLKTFLVSKMRKVEEVDLFNPFLGLKFYESF